MRILGSFGVKQSATARKRFRAFSMKYPVLIGIACLLFLVGLFEPIAAVGQANAAKLEREAFQALNEARTNPKLFARYIIEFRKRYQGKSIQYAGNVSVTTEEGTKAVDEAIEFLQAAQPIEPLTLSPLLSKAAAGLALEQSKNGKTGHNGANGSTMVSRIEAEANWSGSLGENIQYGMVANGREIVIQLMIDDGVPSRGHRTNMMKPGFRAVGLSVSTHPEYQIVCVMDFATSATPK
jgi:uncharacterized protein YkwD